MKQTTILAFLTGLSFFLKKKKKMTHAKIAFWERTLVIKTFFCLKKCLQSLSEVVFNINVRVHSVSWKRVMKPLQNTNFNCTKIHIFNCRSWQRLWKCDPRMTVWHCKKMKWWLEELWLVPSTVSCPVEDRHHQGMETWLQGLPAL